MDQPELITQLQLGDESAFTKLVNEYEDMVYNTALGIVQQADDADDITQEVFIQVYQSISSFKSDSKFSTWLYRIAVSKALDHEKKKKRKKRFGFVQSLFGGDGEEQVHPVEFDHPGIQAEKKESAAALFRALKQIPDNQRIVFSLHKLEGQSNREIAAIMNTSLQAVESLMSRAKASLKKELNDYYQKNIT
ncbi:MAG: RNA polymerase sigma factor [Ferruginibacter sp.]